MKEKITELIGNRANLWMTKDGKCQSIKQVFSQKGIVPQPEQVEEFNLLCDLLEKTLHIDPT